MLVALANVKFFIANKKTRNMKKTFLAMLLVGGTMSMFAQNTQTGSTTTQGNNTSTTNPTTTQQQNTSTSTQQATTGQTTADTIPQSTGTTGTTQQSTGTTGDPTNATGNNVSNMNNSAATGTTANGNWNGVSASTSWNPETPPAYSWNNYGNWQNMGSVYPTGNANMNNSSNMNNTAANGTMNSTGSYSAYGGTAVANLPANVQMRFNQDFPTGANNQYSWNQYGDWFHTHYVSGGRLWQYFYSQRGEGYALVLPVLHSYVPENIINSAIQKYGSSLYSIAMVKTNSGADAYQIGLLQGGQLNMQYLDESGVSVNDVWRVEDSTSMNATQSNAAMDNSGTTSGNWSSDASNSQQSSTSTDMNNQSGNMNSQSGDMNNQSSNSGKSKLKIKNADGSETKIKTKNGETKVKNNPDNNNQNQQ
jgi:hypothetical protein